VTGLPRVRSGRSDAEDARLSAGDFSLAVTPAAVVYTTWIRQQEQGNVDTSLLRSVWTSEPYNHCNFTALPDFDRERAKLWSDALLTMDGSDPRWRRLMELEGLTRWVPGRKEGYEQVERSVR
jgi:ABC-type phosphate/phosphonate transport system substrate-binding protein